MPKSAYNANVYTISFSSADSTGVVKDIFEITPSTQANIEFRKLVLGKIAPALSSTAIELLTVSIYRGATDADAGGSTGSGVLMDSLRGATHTFDVQLNSSSPGSSEGGAAELLYTQPWNTQLPFVWEPIEDERPSCKLSQRLQVRLGAPAGTITIGGTLVIEETGKMPGLSDS